jgi:hypothetical protein
MPMLATSLKPQRALNQQSPKLPAPYMGMDTMDAYPDMPITYAIQATNCVASPTGGLTNRQGYEMFATGFSSPVTSLLVYNSRNTNQNQMFAVSGGSFFNVSSAGAIGSAVVTGQSTSAVFWQSAQQVNDVNTYLIAVNGTNAPQLYNGSTWTTCTQVASPSAPGQFSNTDNDNNAVNIESFMDVTLHAQRWWFVSANSTIAYYTNIGEVGGQLFELDFGTVFPRGGFLQKLISWTISTQYGIIYNLVGISSSGDMAIYQGPDPTQSITFGLAGQYSLGAPIGQRCSCDLLNGDVAYLSQDGLYALSSYIQSGEVAVEAALTYKITPTLLDEIAAFGTDNGWQPILYPAGKSLILNVPQSAQAQNTQFVYNMIIKGWTQFTGWPAVCWGLFNSQLYFGGTNFVGLAFNGGYMDGVSATGSGGTPIISSALQAFSDLGISGYKSVKQIRPFFTSGQSNPSVSCGINVDFDLTPPTGTTTFTPPSGSLWGSALWGSSTWGSQISNPNAWITVNHWDAEYVGVAIVWSATTATTWISTDLNIFGSGFRFG